MTQRHGPTDPPPEHSLLWRVYLSTWSVVFALTSIVGVLVTITTLAPGALAGLVLAVALPTAASFAAWSTVSPMPRRLPLVAGLWAAILMLVAHGLVTILGPWSLLWLIALCLGSPLFLGLFRSGISAVVRPPRKPAAAPVPDRVATHLEFEDPHASRLLDPECPPSKRPDIAGLTRTDLDILWRMSGSWLAQGLNAAETTHLARLRESCLDEIERRDPVAFGPWVAAEHPWVDESSDVRASDDRDPPPESAGTA